MKTKKSKKTLMIIAVCLMVALVIGMGTMTYARYISTTDIEGTQATAAKWGYVVTADAGNMFGTDYTKGEGEFATVVTENGVAVRASSENLILAPGTSGSMVITVNGTAEVLAQLSITIGEDTTIPSVEVTEDEETTTYEPILWTLLDGEDVVVEDVSLEELTSAASALASVLTPGTALVNKTYTISWEWQLDSGNDELDTAIGLEAAGETTDSKFTNIETVLALDLSVTIMQIQEIPAED